MTTDPLRAALGAVRTAACTSFPRAFISFGPGADIDAAFDEASASAGNDHGYTGVHPSLASADSDTVAPAAAAPLPAPAAALAVGAALVGGELAPGVVHAFPVAVPSGFVRRRARVTLTDPCLVVPPVGPVGHLSGPMRAALVAALEAAGVPLGAGEMFESVEVVRERARFKPVVTAFRTKAVSSWVLLDPVANRIVESGFASATVARRRGVELAKAGPLSDVGEDPQTAALEVVKVTRREDGAPFLRIARDRVKTAVVVKVVLITEKDAAKTKTSGWLFAGTDPTPVAVVADQEGGDLEG